MPRSILVVMLAVSLAFAQAPERYYVVAHVDLMAPFTEEGGKLVSEHASVSRKDAGAVRYEVLVEPGRRNHLTIVSVWVSREAFEKHAALDHTRRFRDQLQPMLGGPLDERLHVLMP
jgi:quinol monooxygenase YgiN